MKITDDKLLGHIRAIMYPRQRHKWENGKVPKNEAKDILSIIRGKQSKLSNIPQDQYEEPVIKKTLTQKQWTKFARTFVEKVGDSKVDSTTGLTNQEVLDHIGKDLQIFDEYDYTVTMDSTKLRAFLRSLGPSNKFNELFDKKSD